MLTGEGDVLAVSMPRNNFPLRRDSEMTTLIAGGIGITPMLAMMPDEKRAALAADIPHPKRLGDPREFAGLVAHIIENSYLNGETIRLDGAIRMAPR